MINVLIVENQIHNGIYLKYYKKFQNINKRFMKK